MGLLETQNLLARLYIDQTFRAAFLSEPETVGLKEGLTESEIFDLLLVVPEELNLFAESLFYKRLREVQKILPVTHQILEKEFEILFREFAAQSLPGTIKKHLEDAVNFADFLQTKTFDAPWTKDLAKFEQAKLKFNGYNQKFIFCRFNYDVRDIAHEILYNGANNQKNVFPKRKTLAVWLRIGGKIRHFIW